MSVSYASQVEQIGKVYPELIIESIYRNAEGQNNDVFIVNNTWVFRFPKYPIGIDQLSRETALLTHLQEVVPLPIPNPVYRNLESDQVGAVFVGYKMIEGTPLRRAIYHALDSSTQLVLAEQVGRFLQALHHTEHESIDGLTFEMQVWKQGWTHMYERIRSLLFPAMRSDVRTTVARHFEAFLEKERNFSWEPALIHGDFGPGNILYDPSRQQIGGVIDFGSVAVGDPAVDYANMIQYGDSFFAKCCEATPERTEWIELLTRAHFYKGTFALQEALFGAEQGDERAYREGIAAFR